MRIPATVCACLLSLCTAEVQAGKPSAASAGDLLVWAAQAEHKVLRDERPAYDALKNGTGVPDAIWGNTGIALAAAGNETVGFCLMLEAPDDKDIGGITVEFSLLKEKGGKEIKSRPPTGKQDLFNWVGRPIELFHVRYLEIKGLSTLGYESYDERHIPARLRLSYDKSTGKRTDPAESWRDRSPGNRHYPDIAVPLALKQGFGKETPFSVAKGQSQCIWVDIYVAKENRGLTFNGEIAVTVNGNPHKIGVELKVHDFELPQKPSLRTMLPYSLDNIQRRYLKAGTSTNEYEKYTGIIDRHVMMSWRHRIAMVGNFDDLRAANTPCHVRNDKRVPWEKFVMNRLNGTLFTNGKNGRGYAGTGEGLGTDLYVVGIYKNWMRLPPKKKPKTDPCLTDPPTTPPKWAVDNVYWRPGIETDWQRNTDRWENWFSEKKPLDPFRFLYLSDEENANTARTAKWARWVRDNPGTGNRLQTFATLDSYHQGVSVTKALNIPCVPNSGGSRDAAPHRQSAVDEIKNSAEKTLCYYNGQRPWSGSFVTEDDNFALVASGWAMHKLGIELWFYWESTYYRSTQHRQKDPIETDVFKTALTFGNNNVWDYDKGFTGRGHNNGDGVLFYPGTDVLAGKHDASSNYGVEGPFASLRLKHWRRGLQDYEYLRLANCEDSAETRRIVNTMVPQMIWEIPFTDPKDATYADIDIPWKQTPKDWLTARRELARIIKPGTRCP